MATRTKGPRYYTTSKTVRDFQAEIFGLLGDFGARSFHVSQGENSEVGFVLDVGEKRVPFRMRPNVKGVRRRLVEAGVERRAKHGPEAVAWGQLRHLLELQLEAVESGALTVSELLGGLAVLSGGETVAEAIESTGTRLLLAGGAR